MMAGTMYVKEGGYSHLVVPEFEKQHTNKLIVWMLNAQQDNMWKFSDGRKPTWWPGMTAVALKGLANLGFTKEARWVGDDARKGSIKVALDYLEKEYTDNKRPGADLWDRCQIALALHKFDRHATGKKLALDIVNEGSRKKIDTEDLWYGPAYYAAVLDVIACYGEDISVTPNKKEKVLKALMSFRHKNGSFQNTPRRRSLSVWHTSLVLRTLATQIKEGTTPVKFTVVKKAAKWLIDQLKDTQNLTTDEGRRSMFIAQALDGLCAYEKALTSMGEDYSQTREVISLNNEELKHDFVRELPDEQSRIISLLLQWN